MTGEAATYQFSIVVRVRSDDIAYGDPEWVADAAAGALANIYGYECTYGEVVELPSEVPET